jgi:hypothetical protein
MAVADRTDVEKRAAVWAAAHRRKEMWEPERGYVTRYEDRKIDEERARQEAAAASELAKQFLSDR